MVLQRAGLMMAAGLAIGGGVAWYASPGADVPVRDRTNDIRILAAALATFAGAGLLGTSESLVPDR
jgi:hypothetical protein